MGNWRLGLGLGIGIKIGDWAWELKIGDLGFGDLGLGVEIKIENFEIGIRYRNIGDWILDQDWGLELWIRDYDWK